MARSSICKFVDVNKPTFGNSGGRRFLNCYAASASLICFRNYEDFNGVTLTAQGRVVVSPAPRNSLNGGVTQPDNEGVIHTAEKQRINSSGFKGDIECLSTESKARNSNEKRRSSFSDGSDGGKRDGGKRGQLKAEKEKSFYEELLEATAKKKMSISELAHEAQKQQPNKPWSWALA